MATEIEKPINLFALGAFFLEYCVKHGWLKKKGQEKSSRWYLTEACRKDLLKFNVDLSKL
jgi:hypothetical protein